MFPRVRARDSALSTIPARYSGALRAHGRVGLRRLCGGTGCDKAEGAAPGSRSRRDCACLFKPWLVARRNRRKKPPAGTSQARLTTVSSVGNWAGTAYSCEIPGGWVENWLLMRAPAQF